MKDRIEILSTGLLDEHRPLVEELKQLAQRLGIGLGWHYLLDLTWIISQLGSVDGRRILDAGAGTGLAQWYLAAHGARVISVDRVSRADLSLRFRARYRLRGLRQNDLLSSTDLIRLRIGQSKTLSQKFTRTLRGLAGLVMMAVHYRSPGMVLLYNQNLASLPMVEDNSQDAVIAVSALEHNPPVSLGKVVGELMRVLKPGGVLMATLAAAKDRDWLHEPSQGWCYTERSLRRIFQLSDDAASNFQHHDQLLADLIACTELRDNLADFYFHSGDNGMPWGEWNPEYQPVGVVRMKNDGAS